MAKITLISEEMRERFERFVHHEPNTGCFLWAGGTQRHGYGAFSVGRSMLPAHRVAWLLAGRELPDGAHLLHLCDNPPCVNIDHLRLGTHRDNMNDMARKWRGRKGTSLPFGVALGHRSSRYCAYVRCNGKRLHLGTFDTIEEAHRAAMNKKRELLDG